MKILSHLIFLLPVVLPAQEVFNLNYDTDSKSTYQLSITRDNELLQEERTIAEDSAQYNTGTVFYPSVQDQTFRVFFQPHTSQDIEISIIEKLSPPFSKLQDSIREIHDVKTFIDETPWLKATIDSKGALKSFYSEPETKEFVRLLFTLPVQKIPEGAFWKVPVNFIQLGANFNVVKASNTNQAVLEKVTEINGHQIASITFVIEEQIEGTLTSEEQTEKLRNLQVSYQGEAKFDITAGRWIEILSNLKKTTDFPLLFPEEKTTYNLLLHE